ncbi:hypothetical protein M758_8G188100 [Ceratodon purpureus]|uniref:Uncharacterized protein n=1 Tax=Ceratodon purpureus TaxID=3225 RepID=A0A8T0H8S7_CERPU|nr:hypothetical protein KC19_8G193100 [Ceratodon purpureus]KAG0609485.1 hypothetical protein M758_8G188100 [Ceratodon purpureus]
MSHGGTLVLLYKSDQGYVTVSLKRLTNDTGVVGQTAPLSASLFAPKWTSLMRGALACSETARQLLSMILALFSLCKKLVSHTLITPMQIAAASNLCAVLIIGWAWW